MCSRPTLRRRYGSAFLHELALLSFAALYSGDTLGIAKSTEIAKSTDNVIVACPAPVKAECYQDALTKIYDDIRNNDVRNAVIQMAIYFHKDAPGVTDEVCISTNSASYFSHIFANMISEASLVENEITLSLSSTNKAL